MSKIEEDALTWADGEGFGILTDLGVRSTHGDGPGDKRPDYGMDCDPRDILRAAYVQVAPIVATLIAQRIRQNCTPSAEAYAKGGDFLIADVAAWIESPPEWVNAPWVAATSSDAVPGGAS